jgi:hypothetical protein
MLRGTALEDLRQRVLAGLGARTRGAGVEVGADGVADRGREAAPPVPRELGPDVVAVHVPSYFP